MAFQSDIAPPTVPADYRQWFEITAELSNFGLLLLAENGRIEFSNGKASEFLGRRAEELPGRSFETLIAESDGPEFKALLSRARNAPGARVADVFETSGATGPGLSLEVSLMAVETGGRVLAELRPPAPGRTGETPLSSSALFLEEILAHSTEGIIVADLTGRIIRFNQSAFQILGWPEDEVVGRMILSDLLGPTVVHDVFARLDWDDPRDGPPGLLNPLDVMIMGKSGERLPVNLKASSVKAAGGETAVVLLFTDLRLRAAMARALKETRDYLNNVLENAFDMIITTDLDTHIVSFNRGGERMLGYSRDEVIGRSVEMLYVDPNERRSLLRRMEHFDGAVTNYETRLRHKNGNNVDISLTISYLTDNQGKVVGTVGISKDITARKKAEAELQATKDYLNAIMENTTDMIITTDLDKRIVSFNRGAEKMLGYPRDSVIGVPIEDLYVDPGERQMLARYLDEEEQSVNYETQLVGRDGRVVDIDLTLSHLFNKWGERIGTVGISKDITEKKRVEAELEEKKAELEEAQLLIMHAEKMASLGKLATSVAHEINNPLGGILLFCEMILEDLPEEDENRSDLLQIREQTLRCREIVKGLLEFGRMTGTHFTFIDLNRTVEQGIALFANQVIFQNIVVKRVLDPDLPQILGDSSQLNQVFTNLITNAVDAMDSQGELTIRTRVDEESEEVLIEFSDTGHGIDPDVLPRLFEPFFTTKPVGQGLGLGLSNSYAIVKRHNGRIEVESELGRGASFTIHLPLEALEVSDEI
ncbi:MAG: PAS domain S-box protein [Proteobacteria bacterium]|nr:PAS domain S-box protein [Pseudomonadota bacterium]